MARGESLIGPIAGRRVRTIGGATVEIVEGTVGLIGAGTWTARGDSGSTNLSVLEIGDKTYKRIRLHDYLSNHITTGRKVRALISWGLTRGLISRPFIAAVSVDGKTYKADSVLTLFALKLVLWLMLCAVAGAIYLPLGIVLAIVIAGFYLKAYLDFTRF